MAIETATQCDYKKDCRDLILEKLVIENIRDNYSMINHDLDRFCLSFLWMIFLHVVIAEHRIYPSFAQAANVTSRTKIAEELPGVCNNKIKNRVLNKIRFIWSNHSNRCRI